MSTRNFNKHPHNKKTRTHSNNKDKEPIDFSKVGGLTSHINTLRDLIIFPLLHGDVYSHFKIKAPKGVLFYGPPGTGKTLVAGALATEMSRDGAGKVAFFQRKGADVLDKWVGESEKKLRDLFDKAAKSRPSVIFFDELDGLAPVRSEKNDHVHCSVVATLLALMDGLDSTPGVIVIGATNRLESVDPALRRPGRFDKELYFPLPGTDDRKEILQVHTQAWKHKPTPEFLNNLAEITVGFCGSDLQALCADAVLCCAKRLYPNILKRKKDKIQIDLDSMKVDESDFLSARQNMMSSSVKMGSKSRRLSSTVKPLLERQLNKVINHIKLVWPHFLQKGFKYLIGNERYAGRIVLFGSNKQGVNTHLLPAILQHLEHMPVYILDIPTIFDKNINIMTRSLPSILVLSHIDEWWNFLQSGDQTSLAATLEEIHAELPILTIATCKEEIPKQLHDFFYGNCSMVINIDDPNSDEKAEFLAPIFFGEKQQSMTKTLNRLRNTRSCGERGDSPQEQSLPRLRKRSRHLRLRAGGGKNCKDVYKLNGGRIRRRRTTPSNHLAFLDDDSRSYRANSGDSSRGSNNDEGISCCRTCKSFERRKHLTAILSDVVQDRSLIQNLACDKPIKTEPKSELSLLKCSGCSIPPGDGSDPERTKIFNLWKRAYQRTAKNMTVSELELLYDAIVTCINMYGYNFKTLCEHLESILDKFESSAENQEK